VDRSPDQHHLADPAGFDDLPDLQERRFEPVVLEAGDHSVDLVSDYGQQVDLSDGLCHRFLEYDVFACMQSHQAERDVGVRRCRDHDEFDLVVGDQVLRVGIRCRADFVGRLLPPFGRRVGDDPELIRQVAQAGGVDVPAAAAEPDDANSYLFR
jgi:hypothetical protein